MRKPRIVAVLAVLSVALAGPKGASASSGVYHVVEDAKKHAIKIADALTGSAQAQEPTPVPSVVANPAAAAPEEAKGKCDEELKLLAAALSAGHPPKEILSMIPRQAKRDIAACLEATYRPDRMALRDALTLAARSGG